MEGGDVLVGNSRRALQPRFHFLLIIVISFIIVVINIMTPSISATLAVKSYCCQFIKTSGRFSLTCSQIHPSLHTGHRGPTVEEPTSG